MRTTALLSTFAMLLTGVALLVLPAFANAQDLPAIYVQDLSLDKTSYNQGDTIHGTAVLVNDSSSAQPQVSYSVQLAGGYGTNTVPSIEYASQTFGPVNLAVGQSLPISFTFIVPSTVAGNDLGLQVQAVLSDGTPLGWDDARFSVAGTAADLTVTDDSVIVGNMTWGNQDGPTVHVPQETGYLHIALQSGSSQSMTLTPVMTIYNRTVTSGAVVGTRSFDPVTVAANGTASSTFALPTFNDAPGVYEGTIAFNNASGVSQIPLTTFRYIIGGNIATIHSVTSDETSGSAGATVNLNVSYSGNPPDIEAGAPATSSSATLSATLLNESGQSVGQSSAAVDLNSQDQSTLPLTLTGNARSLTAQVSISSDGQVLASTTVPLSASPAAQQSSAGSVSMSVIEIVVGVLVLILLLLFYGFLRKQSSSTVVPPAALMLLPFLLLIVFALPSGARAYTVTQDGWQPALTNCTVSLSYGGWGSYAENTTCLKGQFWAGYDDSTHGWGESLPEVFINSPTTVTPGQQFYLEGSTITPACLNSPQGLYVLATYGDVSYNKYRYTAPTGAHDPVNYTDQYSLGPFTAPSQPGTYKVDLGVAYYTGPDSGGQYSRNGVYGYQTFTVACAAGQSVVNGQCEAGICPDGSAAPNGESTQCTCAQGNTSACNTGSNGGTASCPAGNVCEQGTQGSCGTNFVWNSTLNLCVEDSCTSSPDANSGWTWNANTDECVEVSCGSELFDPTTGSCLANSCTPSTGPVCESDGNLYNVSASCKSTLAQTCPWGCSSVTNSCTAPPPPYVDFVAIPSLVDPDGTTDLSWSATNVQSCTLQGSNGDGGNGWGCSTGSACAATTTLTSSKLTQQTIYTLSCEQLNGTTYAKQVTVNLSPNYQEQ